MIFICGFNLGSLLSNSLPSVICAPSEIKLSNVFQVEKNSVPSTIIIENEEDQLVDVIFSQNVVFWNAGELLD